MTQTWGKVLGDPRWDILTDNEKTKVQSRWLEGIKNTPVWSNSSPEEQTKFVGNISKLTTDRQNWKTRGRHPDKRVNEIAMNILSADWGTRRGTEAYSAFANFNKAIEWLSRKGVHPEELISELRGGPLKKGDLAKFFEAKRWLREAEIDRNSVLMTRAVEIIPSIARIITEFYLSPGTKFRALQSISKLKKGGIQAINTASKFMSHELMRFPSKEESVLAWDKYAKQKAKVTAIEGGIGATLGVAQVVIPKRLPRAIAVTSGFTIYTGIQTGWDPDAVLETAVTIIGFEALGAFESARAQRKSLKPAVDAARRFNPSLADKTDAEILQVMKDATPLAFYESMSKTAKDKFAKYLVEKPEADFLADLTKMSANKKIFQPIAETLKLMQKVEAEAQSGILKTRPEVRLFQDILRRGTLEKVKLPKGREISVFTSPEMTPAERDRIQKAKSAGAEDTLVEAFKRNTGIDIEPPVRTAEDFLGILPQTSKERETLKKAMDRKKDVSKIVNRLNQRFGDVLLDKKTLQDRLDKEPGFDEDAAKIFLREEGIDKDADPSAVKITGRADTTKLLSGLKKATIEMYQGHSVFDTMHELAHVFYDSMSPAWRKLANQAVDNVFEATKDPLYDRKLRGDREAYGDLAVLAAVNDKVFARLGLQKTLFGRMTNEFRQSFKQFIKPGIKSFKSAEKQLGRKTLQKLEAPFKGLEAPDKAKEAALKKERVTRQSRGLESKRTGEFQVLTMPSTKPGYFGVHRKPAEDFKSLRVLEAGRLPTSPKFLKSLPGIKDDLGKFAKNNIRVIVGQNIKTGAYEVQRFEFPKSRFTPEQGVEFIKQYREHFRAKVGKRIQYKATYLQPPKEAEKLAKELGYGEFAELMSTQGIDKMLERAPTNFRRAAKRLLHTGTRDSHRELENISPEGEELARMTRKTLNDDIMMSAGSQTHIRDDIVPLIKKRTADEEVTKVLSGEMAATSSNVRKAAELFRTMLNETGRLGLTINPMTHLPDGSYVPTKLLPNFFPRRLRPEYKESMLVNPGGKFRNAIDYNVWKLLVKEGKIPKTPMENLSKEKQKEIISIIRKHPSRADFEMKLTYQLTGDPMGDYGHFERQRVMDFPKGEKYWGDYFETSAVESISAYMKDFWSWFYRRQLVGYPAVARPKRESEKKMDQLLKRIADTKGEEAAKRARQIVMDGLGFTKSNEMAKAILKPIRQLNVIRLIGYNPTLALQQLGQNSISIIPKFGFIPFARALVNAATGKYTRVAKTSGAFGVEAQTRLALGEVHGRMKKFLKASLFLFKPTDNAGRYMGGGVSLVMVDKLIWMAKSGKAFWERSAATKMLAKKKNISMAEAARQIVMRDLKRMGIEDPATAIKDGKLSELEQRRVFKGGADKFFFQTDPLSLPRGWRVSEYLSTILQFTSFGWKQVDLVARELYHWELIENHNPLPIVRLLIGAGISGEALHWFINALMGEERTESSLAKRIAKDYAFIGAFGLVESALMKDPRTFWGGASGELVANTVLKGGSIISGKKGLLEGVIELTEGEISGLSFMNRLASPRDENQYKSLTKRIRTSVLSAKAGGFQRVFGLDARGGTSSELWEAGERARSFGPTKAWGYYEFVKKMDRNVRGGVNPRDSIDSLLRNRNPQTLWRRMSWKEKRLFIETYGRPDFSQALTHWRVTSRVLRTFLQKYISSGRYGKMRRRAS